MTKKLMVVLITAFGIIALGGCDWFSKKPSDTTTTDVKTQAVSYDDFKSVATRNYYNLLPQSVYNQTIVDHYKTINYQSIIDALEGQIPGTLLSSGSGAYMPAAMSNVIEDTSEINKGDLPAVDMTKVFAATNDTVSGPVDFVYSNVASVNLYLELIGKLTEEFAKYGQIKFDGTVLTIPGSVLGTYPNPIDGSEVSLADIKGKFTAADGKSNMFVSTVNNKTFTQDGESITAEVGLYLQLSVGKSTDGVYVVEISYHMEVSGSANGDLDSDDTADTGTISLNIGGYIKTVDNKSVNVNTETSGVVNINFSSQEDINENISVKSAFALTKGDKTEAVYKVSQNALTTGDFVYYLTADANKALVYVGGRVGDDDFYGGEIPAQKVAAMFVYNNKNEIEFAAGSADVNVSEFDYDTYETVNKNYKYTGYGWNMNCLDGWTKLVEYSGTNNDLYGTYNVYNNDTLVLGESGMIYNESEDGMPVEAKAVTGGPIDTDFGDSSFTAAIFVHLSQSMIDLSLPNGLTSTNQSFITDSYNSYIKADKTGDSFGVDFANNPYKVPALDKTRY